MTLGYFSEQFFPLRFVAHLHLFEEMLIAVLLPEPFCLDFEANLLELDQPSLREGLFTNLRVDYLAALHYYY